MRATLCLALALGACDHVTVEDSLDIDLDFFTITGSSGELHSPYVKGTTFRLYVEHTDGDVDLSEWRAISADASIVRVDGQAGRSDLLTVDVTAAGEGVVEIEIVDGDGDGRAVRELEVWAPDRVDLLAYGPLLIGRPDEDAAVQEARLLEGGTATYLVRYTRDGRLLGGHGVLSANTSGGVTATPRTTFLFEDREWLQLTAPDGPGTGEVELFVDGDRARAVPVTIVGAASINEVTILTNEEGAEPGDGLVALAQSFDTERRRIFGVEYEWTIGGLVEDGAGDIYRYTYASDQPQMAVDRFGDKSGQHLIHSSGGAVDSSNDIGCSATPGGTDLTSSLWLAAPLLLLLRRRR
jgi:hypothetical protein